MISRERQQIDGTTPGMWTKLCWEWSLFWGPKALSTGISLGTGYQWNSSIHPFIPSPDVSVMLFSSTKLRWMYRKLSKKLSHNHLSHDQFKKWLQYRKPPLSQPRTYHPERTCRKASSIPTPIPSISKIQFRRQLVQSQNLVAMLHSAWQTFVAPSHQYRPHGCAQWCLKLIEIQPKFSPMPARMMDWHLVWWKRLVFLWSSWPVIPVPALMG